MPKSILRAAVGRMQFTLHATRRTPHGALRLVQAMSAWLVKTQRVPSRHRRDARVYGHTTTAMHTLSTPPPEATKTCPLPQMKLYSNNTHDGKIKHTNTQVEQKNSPLAVSLFPVPPPSPHSQTVPFSKYENLHVEN